MDKYPMNLEENIQLGVTVITAIITLAYLWKTRIVGVNKELIGKYKDDADYQLKRAEDYKKKYKDALDKISALELQYDSVMNRAARAEERLKAYEGQPYQFHNQSLEGTHEAQ